MMIASDLDGTLLNDKKTIDENASRYLTEYLKKGKVFAVLTSRNLKDLNRCAAHLVENTKDRRYIAFNEGSRIMIPGGKETFDLPQLSIEDVLGIINACRAYSRTFTVLGNDQKWTIYSSYLRCVAVRGKAALRGENRAKYLTFSQLKKEKGLIAWKVKTKPGSKEDPLEIFHALQNALPDHCVTLNEGVLEIMHGQSGKLGALRKICEWENEDLGNVVFFGDEGNDIYCMKETES